jgi:hypothetical protein
MIQSNETGLTGDALDQSNPTKETLNPSNPSWRNCEIMQDDTLIFSHYLSNSECKGNGASRTSLRQSTIDLDTSPTRTDEGVGGVESSFDGFLGLRLDGPSLWAAGWTSGTLSGQGCRSVGGACRRGCCSGESATLQSYH